MKPWLGKGLVIPVATWFLGEWGGLQRQGAFTTCEAPFPALRYRSECAELCPPPDSGHTE